MNKNAFFAAVSVCAAGCIAGSWNASKRGAVVIVEDDTIIIKSGRHEIGIFPGLSELENKSRDPISEPKKREGSN